MAAKTRYTVGKQLLRAINIRVSTQIVPTDSSYETQCTRRCFSSEPFDFKDIIRSNRESRSIDGVKRSMSKKVSQTSSKTTKTESGDSEAVTEEDGSGPDVAIETEVPDWFNVLLEISYTGDSAVDEDKLQQFHEFVEDLELKALPSVGTVISRTKPKSEVATLERWKKSKTKELGGEKEFEKYQKETLEKGVGFHKSVERLLQGERDFPVDEVARGYLESVKDVLQEVEHVQKLEENVAHTQMFYKGKFDCLASYRGIPYMIEWKTSSVHRPMLSTTYDNPMQVVAYLGALNNVAQQRKNVAPVTKALLVVCYKDGQQASVLPMSPRACQKYWQRWQERVYKFWTDQYILQQQNQSS